MERQPVTPTWPRYLAVALFLTLPLAFLAGVKAQGGSIAPFALRESFSIADFLQEAALMVFFTELFTRGLMQVLVSNASSKRARTWWALGISYVVGLLAGLTGFLVLSKVWEIPSGLLPEAFDAILSAAFIAAGSGGWHQLADVFGQATRRAKAALDPNAKAPATPDQ